MTGKIDIVERVRQSATRRILFLPHAVRQMAQPERMITTDDVRTVITNGEVIEDYLDDARGHSCLMLAFVADRPLHVVCSPKDDYLVIITAYLAIDEEWEDDYRKRKKR